MSLFPRNHKTVFVLDHTPYFGISSENPIELEAGKARAGGGGGAGGLPPLAPVCKSLWTCSVEAAVEYCRIVWDLFPGDKLIRFVISDASAHILNTWASTQQNLTHSGRCGGVQVVTLWGSGPLWRHWVSLHLRRLHATLMIDLHKTGRIICITSARDDASLRSLADIALNTVVQQNKKIAASQAASSTSAGEPNTPQLTTIHKCHLVIINVTPEKAETLVNNQPLMEIGNGLMEVEVRVVRAGSVAALLGRLVLPHYKLAITTVTGIPMKEEQNALSSANYDVEILHSADAHAGLRATQSPTELLESVVLKWWTPRGAESGAAGVGGPLWRVTPADVASRPSACLVNFLLNGRSVTLEVPRKGGGRSASHVLAAQGGELWIGALGGRAPHDDPPSLSEGCGGRVTDYRINDFGALMQQNRLGPLRGPGTPARARAQLARHTTYWPLTISSSLIFNLGPVMEPLARLVVRESLTDKEVESCREVLGSLRALELRHESPAPHLAPAVRGKATRREEQWRQLWSELETLIRVYTNSPGHQALLRTLLEYRSHNDGDGASRASVIRATTDSPLSPPPVGAATSSDVFAPRSILDVIRGSPRVSRRPDFAGRMAAGNRPAVLYQQLQQQQDVEATH